MPGFKSMCGSNAALMPEEALELSRGELNAHLRQLFDADAMLAGDRSADGDAQLEDRGAERLGALRLARLVGVVQDERMEVAVARVKDVGAAQLVLVR